MSASLVRLLLASAALTLLSGCGDASHPSENTPHALELGELVFHPTHTGGTLAVVPAEELWLTLDYGLDGTLDRSLEERRVASGELSVFELSGLEPSSEVSYRLSSRRSNERETQPRETHQFRTLKAPGDDVSFAIAADPHTFQNYAQHVCLDDDTGWANLDRSLQNLAADEELDFVLIGTDSAMTKCGGGCPSCVLDGVEVSQRSASNAADALVRYRSVFGPEVYGQIGADLPLLYMLGDHDGERGWGSEEGTCGYTLEHLAWAQAAREATVPSAALAYDGGRDGTYYALRTGELLLVVLDCMRFTTDAPVGPEAWTLGAEQLDWLERTLAESDATFKIVLSEHLVGGLRAPEGHRASICWKGRGGITATEDGTPRGRFLGEQALLHELFKQHGVQLFVSFHDHVVAFGEKLDPQGLPEGVGYLIAGQCAGPTFGEVTPPAPPWSNEAWYREAMDYDGDGTPEYDTGVTGTLEKGIFKVNVRGAELVELEYLRSSASGVGNAERVLRFELRPDGPVDPRG